ncbi:MAG: cobyric acid synthase [Alteromonadaceae bacterium]|nr:cobyric acid synthase [Alteromonadaceae bacterium]
MVQGTASDAGKSMLVAALCRCLRDRGLAVAPFKPQNMALNSAVTADGGEIGRAQAVQAQAAGVEPHVDMNPVLLKPRSDTGAQVVIHGKVVSDMQAFEYHQYKMTAMAAVLASHKRLIEQYDVVVVEGAGSPAEINLRDRDIANMGFAEEVDCPVILIADIDKGGVFAQIVGTLELLAPSERERIVGFVINRFRGDIKLLESGLTWLEEKTNKPVLGVLPYLHNLQLAAEDAIDAAQHTSDSKIKIAVPVFSRISNHTDFDMLRCHPEIELVYVAPNAAIPACDLIILPGSKNVRADLVQMREMGWHEAITRHLRYGGKVLGICGGYQMLGQYISDPNGVEGQPGSTEGLGYLPVTTELTPEKQLTHDTGELLLSQSGSEHIESVAIRGYQIHVGVSATTQTAPVFALLDSGAKDGCISNDNQVAGTYLHGLFDDPKSLRRVIEWAGAKIAMIDDYQALQEQELNRIAKACNEHLDWRLIQSLIQKNK